MKFLLLLLPLLAGCAASRVERPYTKETITAPDGTVTVRETSADHILGGKLDDIIPKKK